MTHDSLTTSDVADETTDKLIVLRSGLGEPVEMTRENKRRLDAEMARELGNPLHALMAEVAIEYRQMAPAREATPTRPL